MYYIHKKIIQYCLLCSILILIFSCSPYIDDLSDQSTNTASEVAEVELPKVHSSTRLQFKNIESLHFVLNEISNDFNRIKQIDKLGFISHRSYKYQAYKKKYIETFKKDPTLESYMTYDIDDDENGFF